MSTSKEAKESWIEELIHWGVEQVEKRSIPDAEALAKEIEMLRNGFRNNHLSEEDASRYGALIVHGILVIALASSDFKIMGIALILKKMDAPVWAGPIAARVIQAGLETTPTLQQAAQESADWFGSKWSSTKLMVQDLRHQYAEKEEGKKQLSFDMLRAEQLRKSSG